jgi:hypothetical protein
MDTKDGAIQLSSDEELPPESDKVSSRKEEKIKEESEESELEEIPIGDVAQKQGL